MKSYVKKNKSAWENAYSHSQSSYKQIVHKLQKNPSEYVPRLLQDYLEVNDVKDKVIGQFACNNGREILSLALSYKPNKSFGFDISSNMIKDANQYANTLSIDATFIETDIYAISEEYNQSIDTLFLLIGVLFWFDDLDSFFNKCYNILKPGGKIYLLDGHPFTNMLAFDDEEGFIKEYPMLPVHSYFRSEPFIDHSMQYMSDYESETIEFTSYGHTLEAILSNFSTYFRLEYFKESNIDYLESFPTLNGHGVPLVFLLKGKK